MKITRKYVLWEDGTTTEDMRPPRPSNPLVPERPVPYDPTPLELATNFAEAMGKVAAGFFAGETLVTTEAEYRERMAACNACPLWDGKARAGLGKCRHKACGCSRLKAWLVGQKCPLAKWPELTLAPK